MECKLCLAQNVKLVKSHIIAKSIHALSSRSENPAQVKILSADPGKPPQKLPSGIYSNFLCANCESIFQKWEDHALLFFKKNYELPLPTSLPFIKLENFDSQKLKLFFISILWKADASTHDGYSRVNIGQKHREKLRQMILNHEPGSWNDWAVFLERYNSDRPSASGMRPAQKGKINNITFYVFYMAGFKVYIKCDNRRIEEEKIHLFINNLHPPLIRLIPFEGSAEHAEYLKTIHLPHNLAAFNKIK